MSKKILMIAGPNGAGKTTMALELIHSDGLLYEFINADEIAKSLAPLHPESMALTASKLMLVRLKALLGAEESFAFETTAAGINYIKHLKAAKKLRYEINLMFLWLRTPEEAVKRVLLRIEQGGHAIPKETIIRRYYAGLRNLLTYYLPLADRAYIMDNSAEDSPKRLIAEKIKNGSLKILNPAIWKKMEHAANERQF